MDVAGQEPSSAARQVPRARGRRAPLPPSRAGPDGQPGGPGAVRKAGAGGERDSRVARRAGVPRGRDPGAPAALRRRAGAPLHHPPQRARPRPLPADRHRALPEAVRGRGHRAGLRAGQGLSQRGHLVEAQPRVHDARVVRGLRRLRRRRRAARAARRSRRRARAGHHPDRARGNGDRPGAALAPGRPSERRSPSGPGSTSRSGRAASSSRRRWAPSADPAEGWGKLVDGLLSKLVEPDADPTDLRARLPGRAVAVRQAPPLRAGPRGALGGVRWAGSRSRTRSRSSTTPTSSVAASSSSATSFSAATRRPSPSTRPSWRRSSTGCRRRPGWASESTA